MRGNPSFVEDMQDYFINPHRFVGKFTSNMFCLRN